MTRWYIVVAACVALAGYIWFHAPAFQSSQHGELLHGQVIQLGDPDDVPDDAGFYRIKVFTNSPDIPNRLRGPYTAKISADQHRLTHFADPVSFWVVGPDSMEAELADSQTDN